MINRDGYIKYSIWEHSQIVEELYTKRCRNEIEEMTCARQAAKLLSCYLQEGDSILDVGCGTGYFYHSLRNRGLRVEYHGIDASEKLISIGRSILPDWGLPEERLRVIRIEDLDASVDHIVCMNVLSNIDNYHKPLERLLNCTRKSIILRESLDDHASYSYVVDKYLDEGINLKVYVNTYPIIEVIDFIESYGFHVQQIQDERTGGKPEMVIDYPHYWKFLLAEKQ
ncbi:class I SAM-dependent methyltransferase [Methanocalculus sp. MC3]